MNYLLFPLKLKNETINSKQLPSSQSTDLNADLLAS